MSIEIKNASRAPIWLGAGAAALALACAGAGADVGVAPAFEGELTVLVADHGDGRSETTYLLTTTDGRVVPLGFSAAPALASGARIRVWGAARADGFVVSRFERADAASGTGERAALLAGTALAPRSFAFVLLDTGGGVNVSAAQATQQLFDASYFAANRGSIRRFYQEASYGVQDITGTVVGPLSFSPASTCDPMGALALRAQVDAMLAAPVTNYLWYFGSRQSGCAWEGLATLGSPAHPTRDTWYNASNGCVVLAQEPGHNFGMQHSSSMKCAGKTFVDAPDGACTHVEYGDPFDPMGGGCRHPNAWQKRYQGWLGGCNSVRLSASGTFTLLPLESACDGIQVLQIPMPHARTFSFTGGLTPGTTTDELTYYYVELRSQAAGFDQGLAPQVQIRIGGDYRGPSESGLHTWLLDMNPGTTTFSDAALAVGQTFTDPAGGVSITATTVAAASATVTVAIEGGAGDPTCLDGTTVAPPGPPTCAGTGAGGSGGRGGSSGSGGGDGGASGVAGAAGGAPPDAALGSADAGAGAGGGGSDGESNGGASAGAGCGCAVAAPRRHRAGLLAALLAGLAAMFVRRRRNARSVRHLAIAGALLAFASLAACARSETGPGGEGGATATGAGGASSGQAGARAGAGGAVTGRGGGDGGSLGGAPGGRGGAVGGSVSGRGGAAGTAGAAGAGGASGSGGAPQPDGGAPWSCGEYPGALCFCDRSGGGSVPACATSWTCCLVGATSCECYDDDDASCQMTAAGASLTRVPACPP